jgi:hypothetical protein
MTGKIFTFASRFQSCLQVELKDKFSADDVDKFISAFGLFQTWSVFVCSFCADADRNEYWHQHAKKAGYALGFNSALVRALAARQDFAVGPVIYGEETALKVATAALRNRLNIWPSFKSPLSQEDLRKISVSLCRAALIFAPFFKPFAFERENEWRLVKVATVDDQAKIQFRANKSFGLVAYYEFKFQSESKIRTRFSESAPANLIPRVLVGPGSSTEGYLSASNAYSVFERIGIKTIVSKSNSTLRFSE